jgi:hypothetical protein
MSQIALARQPSAPAADGSVGEKSIAANRENGYLASSARPLTSLIFLLPLIIVYEVGTRWYAIDPVSHVEQRIRAFNMMQTFFTMCGASSKYLPPAAVVSILLGCHVAHRDVWSARLGVLVGMLLECLMYAVPLVGLGYLLEHCLLMYSQQGNWREWLVLSIGAGIYEELVFRLALFSLLSFLLIDLLGVSKSRALPVIVVVSAVTFSYYHYWGYETFEWPSFIFRSLAGIYFGIIFLWRGFGLTAGSHIAYDVTIVLLRLVGPA